MRSHFDSNFLFKLLAAVREIAVKLLSRTAEYEIPVVAALLSNSLVAAKKQVELSELILLGILDIALTSSLAKYLITLLARFERPRQFDNLRKNPVPVD